MKKGLILNIVLAIAFFSFIVWKYRNSDNETKKLYESLCKEYPSLDINDYLNCRIASIYEISSEFRNDSDFMRITTSEEKKYSIDVKNCINSSELELEDALNVGDSLVKTKGSDTLTVINNNGKYFFKLNTNVQ